VRNVEKGPPTESTSWRQPSGLVVLSLEISDVCIKKNFDLYGFSRGMKAMMKKMRRRRRMTGQTNRRQMMTLCVSMRIVAHLNYGK